MKLLQCAVSIESLQAKKKNAFISRKNILVEKMSLKNRISASLHFDSAES